MVAWKWCWACFPFPSLFLGCDWTRERMCSEWGGGRKLGGGVIPAAVDCLLFLDLTPAQPPKSAICLLKTSSLHRRPLDHPPSVSLSLLMLIKPCKALFSDSARFCQNPHKYHWICIQKCTQTQVPTCNIVITNKVWTEQKKKKNLNQSPEQNQLN